MGTDQDDCETCFYCQISLGVTRDHEHDHAPVPRVAGGEATVPACVTCHDRKDRFGLYAWDATGWQESQMRNIDYGHLDSVGWLQQRASWGTVSQRGQT